MKSIKMSVVALATFTMLLTSCNKDNTKPEVIQYQQPFVAQSENTIDVPDGLTALSNGGDANASAAIAYFYIANAFSSYSSYFAVPQGVNEQSSDKNSVIYTWSYGGFSTFMSYKKESDKYVWTWDWQTPEIERFTYMKAEQNLNGNSGDWSIYNADNPDQVLWTKNWSKDADGNFSSTIQTFNDSGMRGNFEITDNVDGSGSLIYFDENSVKQTEINWNADGSGDYWILDSNGRPATKSWPAS